MSYTTALSDLRILLSDTATHKRSSKKRLIGPIDGNNAVFISYDKRVLDDTLVVYVNEEEVDFALNDDVAGQITLSSAPDINSLVTADYYWTFWLDPELTRFLNLAAQRCSLFDSSVPEQSFTLAPLGLQEAVLYFAASSANKSLIQYLADRKHAEEFLIQQDGNDDANFSKTLDLLLKTSIEYKKEATMIRDEFYERQGRRSKPSFAIKPGVRRKFGPNL